jgi:hypothetical protein
MSPTARDPTTSRVHEDSTWFVEIVEQARAGDKLAFDSLFQYYNARICMYLAHMVGDEEEGRDLAQETFLKAWQGLANIQTGLHMLTQIVTICTQCDPVAAFSSGRKRDIIDVNRFPLYR